MNISRSFLVYFILFGYSHSLSLYQYMIYLSSTAALFRTGRSRYQEQNNHWHDVHPLEIEDMNRVGCLINTNSSDKNYAYIFCDKTAIILDFTAVSSFSLAFHLLYKAARVRNGCGFCVLDHNLRIEFVQSVNVVACQSASRRWAGHTLTD